MYLPHQPPITLVLVVIIIIIITMKTIVIVNMRTTIMVIMKTIINMTTITILSAIYKLHFEAPQRTWISRRKTVSSLLIELVVC